MKVVPIVAGAAALIAGTPAAHAAAPLAGCTADVLSVPGCPPGCVPGAVPESPDDLPALSPAEDCAPGETVPSEGAVENRPDTPPPEESPDVPAQADPYGPTDANPARPDPPHRTRAASPRGATPSRPGGDPTSIVQRSHAAAGTERDSVDNPGHGAMRGGPPGIAPGVHSRRGSRVSPRPELPKIVPGPSASAPASKLTTLAPTEPLRAGRQSWAAMIGAAVVAETGLLWLTVGLILRRRGRSRSRR